MEHCVPKDICLHGVLWSHYTHPPVHAMTEYLNDFRVPEIGQVINMPLDIGGTATITSLLMPQSQGYYTVSAVIDNGQTWVVDTVYDTVTETWQSRRHKAIIYPDYDGWMKGL